jgi:hypothetical protein
MAKMQESFQVNPIGQMVAVEEDDGTVSLLNAANLPPSRMPPARPAPAIAKMEFTPTGRRISAISEDVQSIGSTLPETVGGVVVPQFPGPSVSESTSMDGRRPESVSESTSFDGRHPESVSESMEGVLEQPQDMPEEPAVTKIVPEYTHNGVPMTVTQLEETFRCLMTKVSALKERKSCGTLSRMEASVLAIMESHKDASLSSSASSSSLALSAYDRFCEAIPKRDGSESPPKKVKLQSAFESRSGSDVRTVEALGELVRETYMEFQAHTPFLEAVPRDQLHKRLSQVQPTKADPACSEAGQSFETVSSYSCDTSKSMTEWSVVDKSGKSSKIRLDVPPGMKLPPRTQ